MVRKAIVFVHRWAGLVMALPLILVALTGSILAFHDEIDRWLNPDLLTVPERHAPLLSGVTLRDKAAALYPGLKFDDVPLDIQPGRSVLFSQVRDPNRYMETEFQFFLDPYTGKSLGERPVWSGPSLSRRNILSYLFRVHFDLALPWSTGELGGTILGVTALVWTLDCFFALFLTFPRFGGQGTTSSAGKWLRRWGPAWKIKFRARAFRVNFDIHRAFGLWTWLALLIFAWSSVGFNFGAVFNPVMHGMLPYAETPAGLPQRAKPLDHPGLDWQAAYATGHALLAEQARAHGYVVDRERALNLDRAAGAYTIFAKAASEGDKTAQTSVTFDADTGKVLSASWPGSQPQRAGDIVTNWLFWLHTSAVWGLPLQIAIFLMGLVITALAGTGVYIWWKKPAGRVCRPRTGASGAIVEARP